MADAKSKWTEPKLEVLEINETAGALIGAGTDTKGGYAS